MGIAQIAVDPPNPPHSPPLCQTDTRRHFFARRRTFYEGWQKALLKKGLLLEVNIQWGRIDFCHVSFKDSDQCVVRRGKLTL